MSDGLSHFAHDGPNGPVAGGGTKSRRAIGWREDQRHEYFPRAPVLRHGARCASRWRGAARRARRRRHGAHHRVPASLPHRRGAHLAAGRHQFSVDRRGRVGRLGAGGGRGAHRAQADRRRFPAQAAGEPGRGERAQPPGFGAGAGGAPGPLSARRRSRQADRSAGAGGRYRPGRRRQRHRHDAARGRPAAARHRRALHVSHRRPDARHRAGERRHRVRAARTGVLHLRRSAARRRLSPRARHDGNAGALARRRRDAARHRARHEDQPPHAGGRGAPHQRRAHRPAAGRRCDPRAGKLVLEAMSLAQFLLALRARLRAFLLVLAAAVAAAAVVTVLMPRTYKATVSLLVDAKDEQSLSSALRPLVLPQERLSYLQTQMDILTSAKVARKVAQDLELSQDPALRAQFERLPGRADTIDDWIAADLLRNLKVETSQSNVMHASFSAGQARFAARRANPFAKAYIDTMLELRVEPTRDAAAWFDEQLKSLRASLEDAQKKLTRYYQRQGIVSSDERFDVESSRLNILSEQAARGGEQRSQWNTRARP